MIQVIYKPTDLRYIFFRGDDSKELHRLEEYLNKIPQFMFLPSFRGVPKPEVFLNKFKTKSGEIIYYCHSGLWKTVYDWCEHNNIQISGIDNNFKYTDFNLSLQEFTDYVNNWNLNIQPRPYQYKAAWLILKYRQSLSQLATRAGKTLIAYLVFRYMLEHGAHNILMIVPSIQLVKQGVEDMSEYKEFFKSETVWAKSELCSSANLTIGTFQSLVKKADRKSKSYNPEFFNKFDLVCVDEAHHLVCKSINTILGLDFMKNIKLKFGFTGTLPPEDTIESFACHSLMGPMIQDISPMELVDGGFLAKPIINQYRINHVDDKQYYDNVIKCGEYLNSNFKLVDGKKILLPMNERLFTMIYEKTLPMALKNVKKIYNEYEYSSYLIDLCKSKGADLLQLEHMLCHLDKSRLKLIDNILEKQNTNGIVFAHNTEYIKFLAEHFKQKFPNKKIYTITGSANLKKRQAIIKAMEGDGESILCASYGCCSTGITFKNVNWGILAQSFKSGTINLQSIGRLMLKTNDKEDFYIYDIIDKWPTKKLYLQGLAKIRTYKEKGFEYNIIDCNKIY